MKIVVLDGYTLNPGDLNWQDLERLGELMVYDRTDPSQIIERAMDAEIVLTNKTLLSSDIIKQLKKLKYIGVLATGYNVVDTETARKKKHSDYQCTELWYRVGGSDGLCSSA